MKTWLKQLFCGHIWKPIEAESLSSGRVVIGYTPIKRYERFAVTSTCLKCGKSRITEEKIYDDLP